MIWPKGTWHLVTSYCQYPLLAYYYCHNITHSSGKMIFHKKIFLAVPSAEQSSPSSRRRTWGNQISFTSWSNCSTEPASRLRWRERPSLPSVTRERSVEISSHLLIFTVYSHIVKSFTLSFMQMPISWLLLTNSMKLILEKQIPRRDFNFYFVCTGHRGTQHK